MPNNELLKQFLNAKNLHSELVDHFSFLVKDNKFQSLLGAIMSKVESVVIDSGALVLNFPGGEKMTCGVPFKGEKSRFPTTYKFLMGRHEFISFPDNNGWALTLGDTRSLEIGSGYLSLFDKRSDVLCPMTDYSDWWVYHPVRKNQYKEPVLCLASHETGDIEELIVSCTVGELFLKRVAEYFGMDNLIPKVETVSPDEPATSERYYSANSFTDTEIYKILREPAKSTDNLRFISELEKLAASGRTFYPTAYDELFVHTDNFIVNCLNNETDPFPVFEAFLRLFPNAERTMFHHQLCYNVGDFIEAIKDHPELYPQIKSRFMGGTIDDDTAGALYRIAVRLGRMGLVNEAREELKRVEESDACPTYIHFSPDDFEEPLKSEFDGLKERMLHRFLELNGLN